MRASIFYSPLWKILHNHYEDFKAGYGEYCEKQYGFFRPVVDEVVEEYLKCGDLHEGFARVRCTNPECKNEYILAFSCKGRWFCPSCHSKKTIQFGEDVTNNILYPVPHRQFVFSIPIMLRIYFKYDRKLLTKLCHCAKESLEIFFGTVLGLDDGILGMSYSYLRGLCQVSSTPPCHCCRRAVSPKRDLLLPPQKRPEETGRDLPLQGPGYAQT